MRVGDKVIVIDYVHYPIPCVGVITRVTKPIGYMVHLLKEDIHLFYNERELTPLNVKQYYEKV
jgi:hypothetical protein